MYKSKILLIVFLLGIGVLFYGCGQTTNSSTTSGVTDPSHAPSNNDLTASSYVGSLTCKSCHGGDNADEMYMKWKNSVHGDSLTLTYTAKLDCALCHATGYKKTGGYTSGSGEANMFGVQCEECHGAGSQHVAAAQKNIADKDTIKSLINKTPSSESTCGKCHRGRVFTVKIGSKYDSVVDLNNKTAVNATIEAARLTSGSGRHPIHYRPNMAVIKGTGGYEYSGSTYTNSYHTAGISNTCVVCHFQNSDKAHNAEPSLNACKACHTGATSFDISGRVTEIQGLLDTLQSEIKTYVASGKSVSAEAYTKALWNLTLISKEADAGKACAGVHNYKYAKQLLQDAIDNFDPTL